MCWLEILLLIIDSGLEPAENVSVDAGLEPAENVLVGDGVAVDTGLELIQHHLLSDTPCSSKVLFSNLVCEVENDCTHADIDSCCTSAEIDHVDSFKRSIAQAAIVYTAELYSHKTMPRSMGWSQKK